MGQVILAGAGQNPARTAGIHAGLPLSVPSITINKVCLSGLNAIATADQLIRAGEAEIVVAGGMESMTNAPHLLPKSREGFKYGDTTLVDSMAYDALWDQATPQAMGALTEDYNQAHTSLTREEQDAFAAASHQKAAAAWKNGVFDDEVVPVSIPQRKGDPIVVSQDEGVRGDTTAESLSALRPAFRKDGTITAGSASQISDGAAAVVVMSKAKAEELGLEWLAEIGAHGMVAGPDSTLQLQPANATQKACDKEGISALRPRPGRVQRGVRRRRHRLDPGAGPRRVEGQRQRRRDRARPPGRHVRRPDRAPPGARAEASRWRRRRGRALRWRRTGRRADRARPRLRWARRLSTRRDVGATACRQATWSPAPATVTRVPSRG